VHLSLANRLHPPTPSPNIGSYALPISGENEERAGVGEKSGRPKGNRVNGEVIEGKVSLKSMRKQAMPSWAAQELNGANLGDQRLNRRRVKIVEALYEQPEASLPQACGSWAATKAAYNFFSSKQVSPQEILEAHQSFWREKLTPESIVLAIQDTSDFNFTHQRSKTFAKGFGLTGTQSYPKSSPTRIVFTCSLEWDSGRRGKSASSH
jgi:Transposase DNA-binding